MVLVEALPNLESAKQIRDMVECPAMVNQIAGGESPLWSFEMLQKMGVSVVNYSTPCLFGAQTGIEHTLQFLQDHDGQLPTTIDASLHTSLESCTTVLWENLHRRDKR